MNLRDPQSLLYLLQDDLEFSNWQLDAPNGAPGPTTMNRKLLRAKGVATNGARTLRTLSKLKVETPLRQGPRPADLCPGDRKGIAETSSFPSKGTWNRCRCRYPILPEPGSNGKQPFQWKENSPGLSSANGQYL